MGKWTLIIRYIVSVLLIGCMFSCQTEEEEWGNMKRKNTLQVMGRVTEFQDHYVSSRALKNKEEALIRNMSIFIFKSDGARAHYEWIEGSRPVFVIDRDDLNQESDAADFANATIYILANVPQYADDDLPANVEALKTNSCKVTGIDLVEEGFPMIGSLTVNLEPTSNLEDNVLEIPLENLYSKIVFNIKVDSDQKLEGFVPSFRLEEWEVHQVPQRVAFGTSEQTMFYHTAIQENGADKVFTSMVTTGNNPVLHKDGVLSFCFYMPEHKVNPAVSEETYFATIENIGEHEKQRHKPCLVDKADNPSILDEYQGKPTYVLLKGVFTDHQGYMKNVSYKIYLGENNYSNFQINRNCQYNNSVTIRGITNHFESSDENISVDHRVTVEKDEFTFYVERETHLDSHFEVRPIDIEFEKEGLDYDGSRVELVLLTSTGEEPTNHNQQNLPGWVRFENMNDITSNSNNHCDNGKRLYFTEDLVTNTLKNNYRTTIRYNDTSKRIWTYFDENTDDVEGVRSATIRAKFYEKDASTPAKVMDFKFQQRNLHPVSYGGRGYLIEYYEEYLYNFDPKENYGNTTDGMEWGLDGVQLSHTDQAIMVTGGWNFISDLMNQYMIPNYGIYYDFYIPRDDPKNTGVITHEYAGYTFCNNIIDNVNGNTDIAEHHIKELTLVQDPKSAIEYCYNKNKRNAQGIVENVKWYLPAIDEIEAITKGGYTEFDVFQNKHYWASQPAFNYHKLDISVWVLVTINRDGNYMTDNVNRARATKVLYKGKDSSGKDIYENEESGVPDGYSSGTLQIRSIQSNNDRNKYLENTTVVSDESKYQGGSMPRTGQINRIRCVYKP